MENKKAEIENQVEAFAELLRCELRHGQVKYELDVQEMYMLRDGIHKMADELTRLRSQGKPATKREVISCDNDPMESFSIDPESYF
jgi:hypothetical protein